jgi:nucleotide-binding universal stress UspA family protein
MYRKILVPLDGSKLSEHALNHLKQIARLSSATKVVLLEVIEPIVTLYAGGPYASDVEHDMENDAKAKAKSYLAKLDGRLKKQGVSTKSVVAVGIPEDVILEYANQNKVDLIIMSTHGRSGISRWFFGSVAEKVIRHSTIPVLVSPPVGSRLQQPKSD